MSMIDRLAMRLAEVYHGKPCSPEYVFGDCTGGNIFVDQARAAIEPLREPTEAMVEAGGEAYYGHPRASAVEWAKEDKFDLHAADAAIFYAAMVNAALKEQEGEKE
ncbi:hypothetical protein [Rhizobium leguminosarum]|uniref:hypothetical protein n=1 Tax=Rhizobium leguminosarum TaxID=384 RepID=UPI000B92AA79|nr:hypothetical protein [Rhizobium leguminosarum]ASS55926.1 hypothetical protein CHR56_15890 [Rhizobium leguminosarum bv. viciae]